jgi:hypothetical protein
MDVAQYVAVTAMLPVLFGGAGYLGLTGVGVTGLVRLTLAPGISVVVAAGLAALSIPSGLSGQEASVVLVIALAAMALVSLAWTLTRREHSKLLLTRDELPPLALVLACYAFLAGFNLIPSNPPGSINPCSPAEPGQATYVPPNHPGPCAVFAPPSLTMSRIPHRSIDDLLQFRVTQAVWNRHLYTERNFAGGWRLQDRTPLLGLVAAGVGSAAGVSYPDTYPPQLWFPQFGTVPGPMWLQRHGAPSDSAITGRTQPSAFVLPGYVPPLIDDWGYWFYRLLTIFLCALVILPTYHLGVRFGGARVGVLAAVAAGLTPAIMQNAYYASPKYLGVYFGLSALLLVMGNRVVWSGLAIAAAYLCHPFSLIVGAPVLAYAALRRSLARAVLAGVLALVVVVPWIAFASSTSRASGLLSHPIGCVGPAVEVDACLDQFLDRPTSDIVWQRAAIIPQMVLPFGVDAVLEPSGRTGLALEWLTIHDFSFPGMVGFVFFALSLIGLWRVWPANRGLLLFIVGGQLAFVVLLWGLAAASAWVAGLGLLPLLFVFGAVGLVGLAPRTALWVAAVGAAEWLLYLRALYYPIEGISAAQYALGWLLIGAGIVVMLAAGYLALFRGWPERGLRGAQRPLAASLRTPDAAGAR